jgi:hypothetical protein
MAVHTPEKRFDSVLTVPGYINHQSAHPNAKGCVPYHRILNTTRTQAKHNDNDRIISDFSQKSNALMQLTQLVSNSDQGV